VPASSDVAISLSVVSPSRDEMFYSDAYWKLRPFSEEWDTKLRVIGVRQVLQMLFERLDLGEVCLLAWSLFWASPPPPLCPLCVCGPHLSRRRCVGVEGRRPR
jgi:hypothetical protein